MKRTGKEGGRERVKEREREAVLSVLSRRGREALGEEDVSQHCRELQEWVEEKKKEKRERPKLEGLFLCRSFSAPNVQDGQIRRGEGVTYGTVYLTVCVHECVRAEAPAVSHQPA